MDNFIIDIFLNEVYLQKDYALKSYYQIEDSINKIKENENLINNTNILNDKLIQNNLTSLKKIIDSNRFTPFEIMNNLMIENNESMNLNKINNENIILLKACFYHIHHFLIHLSNIMKIIHTSSKNKDIITRSEIIRKKLNLNEEDFDIIKLNIRNDLEHYDERIDRWYNNSTNHNYIDMNLGNIQSDTKINTFRNFDVENKIISFFGEDYNLKDFKNFLDTKLG